MGIIAVEVIQVPYVCHLIVQDVSDAGCEVVCFIELRLYEGPFHVVAFAQQLLAIKHIILQYPVAG